MPTEEQSREVIREVVGALEKSKQYITHHVGLFPFYEQEDDGSMCGCLAGVFAVGMTEYAPTPDDLRRYRERLSGRDVARYMYEPMTLMAEICGVPNWGRWDTVRTTQVLIPPTFADVFHRSSLSASATKRPKGKWANIDVILISLNTSRYTLDEVIAGLRAIFHLDDSRTGEKDVTTLWAREV